MVVDEIDQFAEVANLRDEIVHGGGEDGVIEICETLNEHRDED